MISPVSRSYWRLIIQGFKTYDSIMGEDKKVQVKALAQQDVREGRISGERYEELIGEKYVI